MQFLTPLPAARSPLDDRNGSGLDPDATMGDQGDGVTNEVPIDPEMMQKNIRGAISNLFDSSHDSKDLERHQVDKLARATTPAAATRFLRRSLCLFSVADSPIDHGGIEANQP